MHGKSSCTNEVVELAILQPLYSADLQASSAFLLDGHRIKAKRIGGFGYILEKTTKKRWRGPTNRRAQERVHVGQPFWARPTTFGRTAVVSE
jgi:hypothetical protein